MQASDFVKATGCTFFTGVPDSQLKGLCDYLYDNNGISKDHIIAANEGNATALAAGYYMATGKLPLVYMQNSGIGNIINPVASLLNDKVYAIPCLFVVGWRGEPGVKDEPQHIYQGEVTVKLLEDMDIVTCIIDKETTAEDIEAKIKEWAPVFEQGKSAAFVVRKGALSYDGKPVYKNDYAMTREHVIELITKAAGDDIIVSTTGKASRELFEIRERAGETHSHDFLTVGSMGHSSSIALSIALNKPGSRVWCIDGDGSLLMHLGAAAVMGANAPENMVHIVINNGAHETVGGMPTVSEKIDVVKIAEGCGYKKAVSVDNESDLIKILDVVKKGTDCLTLIEIKAALGSRADLGRPTLTARQNVENFMNYLKEKN